MKIIICEHCGEKNDRADYANWCQRCADDYTAKQKAEQARRDKEFRETMDGRPA